VMLMDDIINPIIERFNYYIEKEKRKIILNTAGFEKQKDLIVKTDKNIIDIVFSNLINNAIKYSLNNSNIEINITKREEDILIEVKNYGEGLTSDDISKLFKRFSRIRTASTKKIKGTGLGLFNSKYLIEKLQGKIWCESEYGKWVKFSFTFPYK
ncbi:MAG TPA: ATP-binding protein, partial [bacterium]|nr:ATP-binding protein [bacterium]